MSRHFHRLLALLLAVSLTASLLIGCLPNLLDMKTPEPAPDNSAQNRQGSFIPTSLPVLNSAQAHQRVLWVLDHTERYVVPFVLSVPKVEGVAREAVNRLVDSPLNRQSMGRLGLKLPLPQGTTIRGLTIRDGLAKLDLSNEFLRYNVAKEKLIVDAVVLTLTELSNVDRVQLMVGGKVLQNLPGGRAGGQPIKRSDIVVNPENPAAAANASRVTLYFSSMSPENYVYFVPVTRSIQKPDNQLAAVVNELIAGPTAESGLMRDVPAKAKLLSVRINALKVAEVDFTKEIYDYGKGQIAETALLGSLILTLTEQAGVEGVRLTVEGKAPKFPGGTDVSRPILRPVFVNPFIL